MPQKPQLALYEHEIEIYIANMVTLKGTPASDTEKQKTRKALADITAILNERGHSWPDAGDYDTYSGGHNDKTTKQNVSRIEKFFAWLKGREIDRMPENEITATLDAENSQPELFPADDMQNEPETWPEADVDNEPVQDTKSTVKSKAGRKRLDSENGEIRSEKFTVYLTPTQADALKALCMLDNVPSVADRINSLIAADIENNKEDINGFFALRTKRTRR